MFQNEGHTTRSKTKINFFLGDANFLRNFQQALEHIPEMAKSKYERIPFINRVPLRVPGVSSRGNSSPCLAGVQGNAAEEHRRAAEWTAKLAAENRRKLKGGGESSHPTILVLQELGSNMRVFRDFKHL